MKIKELVEEGILGSYNSCEVFQIIGIVRGENPFNIYTLFIFENSEDENNEGKFLTEKPLKINKEMSIGLIKRRISLEDTFRIYSTLEEENKLEIIKGDFLEIEKMTLLDKHYIPSSESNLGSVKINNILKNNFTNGVYIFEFFSNNKERLEKVLEPVVLNKISEEISKIIPLKIALVPDRIGNIIFQIPINKFKLGVTVNKETEDLELNFSGCSEKEELFIVISSEYDDHISSYNLIKLEKNEDFKKVKISIRDTIKILVTDNKFIYHNSKYTFINIIEMMMHIGGSQKRVFNLDGKKIQIEISEVFPTIVGEAEEYKKWIQKRVYNSQLKDLIKSKHFLQYRHNQREKALNDLRELINAYGKNGVYLWDPYAEAKCIKETLYYLKYSSAEIKVLTSLDSEEIKKTYEEFEKDNKEYLFLNAEVRTSKGSSFGKFHDRFLIFPLDKVAVWSLGTSINGLGKEHHIFQKVSQPQHILNAFNEIWENLGEESIIWKSIC